LLAFLTRRGQLRKDPAAKLAAESWKCPPLLTWLVFDFILNQKREKITFM
jgi:hypothetical protein